MSRLGLYNGVPLVLALVSSLALSALFGGRADRGGSRQAERARDATRQALVVDAAGRSVPVANYRRIVSASTISDHILWEISEPGRVAAYTTRALEHARFGHRFAGKEAVPGLRFLEQVIALKPDLVLINYFADAKYIARLREEGVQVFDLGEMRGMETLVPNIRQLARLIGQPERGEALAQRLQARMAAVAASVPESQRPGAAYVSVFGDKLFGGGARTSYHDVLLAAGLKDAAAAHYEGWPELNAERLLQVDPEIIVTKQGMGPVLCRHPGLELLRVCSGGGRIVEVDAELIEDAGLPMLEAAEALFHAVHGPS